MPRERRRRGPEGPRPAGRERERGRGAAERARGSGSGSGPGRVLALAALGALALGCAAWAGAAYGRWSRAARLVTPLAAPRALPDSHNASAAAPRFWGSYRPHLYLGMKARSPRSPVAGLMWMHQLESDVTLRHTCEQSDRLPGYGWLLHDGLRFGVQEIRDFGLALRTDFVKRPGGRHGGDWSWRVTARPTDTGAPASLVSLLFYVATDGQGELQPRVEDKTRLAAVTGTSEELGHFTVTFRKPSGAGTASQHASYNYLQATSPGLHRVADVVKSSLSSRFVHAPPSGPRQRYFGLDTYRGPPRDPAKPPRTQLLVHQVTLHLPCQLEVLFESGSVTEAERPSPLAGTTLSRELAKHASAFEQRFEETFGLAHKGFSAAEQAFARAALSNVLGGLGYFHGRSLVRAPQGEEPLLYPERPLFTAVPSRSFFPRGFLWDEGFHQLLLARWDPALSREVLAHWLDLMNAEGWIPREQILDDEARAKVPPEFVLQHPEVANPPTFFLTLQQLLAQGEAKPAYLRRLFPRLQAWYDWYNRTQAGPLPYTFRWRGRDTDTKLFLNPKTLASGLDDYPRASHPSPDERHLDLRCWMTLASSVMADVAERLGEPATEYQHLAQALSDNALLEQQHWAAELGTFADYGNHSRAVGLERERLVVPPGQPRHQLPPPRLVRVVREPPRPRFVEALGYVSLFPFLLQLLQPDSPRLGAMLADLRNEAKLWTPFGLRSLAPTSPLYMQRNTEHDAPYWRGPIWVNINYLALRALHHYAGLPGPQQARAAQIYHELRTNLVGNLYRQYVASGYLWEQYNDSTGRGQGCHPFTGWSALVVLVMAEEY
ncbi:mannosyl-oligosaccharide glucosidase isoform X2 [Alligator mississippiensis]|uniref:mannosyl-oligosaccharide glucosidase isoform X2 n=1 Tax=Alligator mississippiensis TaxID=8496 RepID=UPI002877559D|nr:mannosyl-oligosaccharide glucosidase isoform X2 [Alligator mississippiensis]